MPTVGIRYWLKQQGISDKQIGWQDGQVTVGGKSFYQPTDIREGRSYASPEALQSALNALQGGGGLARTAANVTTFGGPQKAPVGTVPVRQYLVSQGYDPSRVGWQDNTVTLGSSGYGITPSAVLGGRSYAPRSVVEAALKASGYQSPEEQQAAAREKQLEDMVQSLTRAASRPLEYNPEDDPRYQAARQLAEAEAGRASQAAMEELNTRGILPSTITADRLGQIRQRSAESVAGMIPGLYQAALQERQMQLGDIGTALNAIMGLQQASQAQQQAELQRQMQEAGLTGEYMGAPTLQAAQVEQEQARQAALDALAQRQAIAALTGIDPETGQPTWERQYAQEQLGLERSQLAQAAARAASSESSGGAAKEPTLTEQSRDALASAYDAVDQAIATGATAEEIRASIDSQYGDLVRVGVDPEKVKAYLDSKKLWNTPTPTDLERQRLQARPWWQRAIDILPGAQYR